MSEEDAISARARQRPLRERYRETPEEALITDRANTTGGVDTDPFHGHVLLGDKEHGVVLPFGIHRAVGGFHDAPNPGDLLCAALAACLDSTLRIIANQIGVTLAALEVEVTAQADVRGTLLVDPEVPVGFYAIRCHTDIRVEEGTDPKLVRKLTIAAERCCVNLQTMRTDVAIETSINEG